MVINVSVQYNGGFLPDIILVTLRDLGTHLIPFRAFVPAANVPTYIFLHSPPG